MIGRVYRGGDVGGLLRYLYGPGRHDDSLHSDPHLVAAWAHHTREDLARLEPTILSGEDVHAVRDFTSLRARLELAVGLRPQSRNERMVWHCALRNDAGDRRLTDAEWAEVARDVMERTGIAKGDDAGGCRWIAVRHDAESIHLVAILARQDGRSAHPGGDFRALRQACIAAEKRYGLVSTAPADRTTATALTQGEHARAARLAKAGVAHVPDRVWLREQVQAARSEAHNPEEFLDRLRAAGVVVRERRDPATGELNGYAVGRRHEGQQSGEVVLYGGGKLAPDLSLPQLAKRWAIPEQRAADQAADPKVVLDPAARAVLWERAAAAAGAAAEQVRVLRVSDPAAAADVAAAAAEVLSAAGRLLEGEPVPGQEGPLTLAGRDYDRAAREPWRATPAHSRVGQGLRAAAYAMARTASTSGGRAGARRGDAVRVALMLAEFTRLAEAIGSVRQAQGRVAQAEAARSAQRHLAQGRDGWGELAEQVHTERAGTERGRAEQERAQGAQQRVTAAAHAPEEDRATTGPTPGMGPGTGAVRVASSGGPGPSTGQTRRR